MRNFHEMAAEKLLVITGASIVIHVYFICDDHASCDSCQAINIVHEHVQGFAKPLIVLAHNESIV